VIITHGRAKRRMIGYTLGVRPRQRGPVPARSPRTRGGRQATTANQSAAEPVPGVVEEAS
jgi:hypothetical protein